MSVVGRFEILSPIFSGVLDTSTARDSRTGDTVLLHLLPAGHTDSPRDLFLKIASDWPGRILDSGIDAETHRPFVVTDYPRDRKAFRLLIHELGRITLPSDLRAGTPQTPAVASSTTPPAAPPAPAPQSDPALDLLAFFKAQTQAAAKPSTKPSPAPEPPTGGGATRLFDPSAVFGAVTPAAATPLEPPKAIPPQDGATRMFDPSAVFGAAASPAAPPPPQPPPANDGATRMFDPSAVFGMAAPAPPKPPASAPATPPQDGATRMFDPSAVFGAAAPQPKTETPPATPARDVTDSAKRAAEAFISGKLPPEFRNAPRSVQRSLEELLGKKADEPDVQPTPGRPGVITLMFDAYGKRIDQSEASAPAPPEKAPGAASNDGATKIISSADLSAMFAAQDGANHPAEPDSDKRQDPKPHAPQDRR